MSEPWPLWSNGAAEYKDGTLVPNSLEVDRGEVEDEREQSKDPLEKDWKGL
ncbi:hypothetical protein SERLA73DRAFT_76048 [Serpula lacrymans var. lacrymans S7.3]|uniref:Uncharacterized protein n=1 Tax=Serpula lacrymans var. lacrymans (strain S7.3) TaxID=936435 RepID=F8Q607_SERL3|nr:hypothetical protein SERLA73DRAFT_76048 [Serpula lacrymans var. lacrymans S7.3]